MAKHITDLRNFYLSGQTLPLSYRLQQLQGIKRFLDRHEADIETVLYQDLHKPQLESYLTEIAIVKSELNYTIKHLSKWMKSKRVRTPIILQPSVSRIYPQPLGVILIIGAWNYPIQTTLIPLIGAIAAGNVVVIKPSEHSPTTNKLLVTHLGNYLDENCFEIIEGGASETTALLTTKFDHIFFTGSSSVGQTIMAAAAQQLTPVTLELGGKSPCIVDETIDLEVAARRIAWAKFTNAGQSCVAPDYVLVHESIEIKLLETLRIVIAEFYGDQPDESLDFGRIINQVHCARLIKLIKENGEIAVGGNYDLEKHYIAPTILRNVPLFSPIMTEEIFGPILPLIRYSKIENVISFINERPCPLALYLFSNNNETKNKIVSRTTSGSVAINHAMQQLAVLELPFGGVGASGMGKYHGKASFDTFTHYKSIWNKPTFFDPMINYPPYSNKLKALLKWFLG